MAKAPKNPKPFILLIFGLSEISNSLKISIGGWLMIFRPLSPTKTYRQKVIDRYQYALKAQAKLHENWNIKHKLAEPTPSRQKG